MQRFTVLEKSPDDALAEFENEPALEESLSVRNCVVSLDFEFDAPAEAEEVAPEEDVEAVAKAAEDAEEEQDGCPAAWRESLEFLMGMGMAAGLVDVYNMSEKQICLACLHKAKGNGMLAFELLETQNIPPLPEAPKEKPAAPSTIVWEGQDEENKWIAFAPHISARIEETKKSGDTEVPDVEFLGQVGVLDLVEMVQRRPEVASHAACTH